MEPLKPFEFLRLHAKPLMEEAMKTLLSRNLWPRECGGALQARDVATSQPLPPDSAATEARLAVLIDSPDRREDESFINWCFHVTVHESHS